MFAELSVLLSCGSHVGPVRVFSSMLAFPLSRLPSLELSWFLFLGDFSAAIFSHWWTVFCGQMFEPPGPPFLCALSFFPLLMSISSTFSLWKTLGLYSNPSIEFSFFYSQELFSSLFFSLSSNILCMIIKYSITLNL